MKRLTDPQLSAMRAVVRACLVVATAFGLRLSAEQVAAVQLAGEALLQAYTQLVAGGR